MPDEDGLRTDGEVNGEAFIAKGAQLTYYLVVAGLGAQLLRMLFMAGEKHRRSGRSLLLCLAVRIVPALFLRFSSSTAITMEQIVSDGLFLSILTRPVCGSMTTTACCLYTTSVPSLALAAVHRKLAALTLFCFMRSSSDIIVAKIADREIHSLVVVMCMASIMSNFAIYMSLFVYYVTVFGDICVHMNLPLLSTVTNVYCDGIFDLLHRGHMEQFRQSIAVTGGTRLFVGVVDDAESTAYKRAPIMREDERYAAVMSCKYVHAVIKGSPLVHDVSKPGEPMTRSERMVEEHNIHYFAVGREYETVKEGNDASGQPHPDYFALPRSRGMCRFTERTEGVSTSTLIRRIVSRADEFLGDK